MKTHEIERSAIDIFTGKSYEDRSDRWRSKGDVLICPYPDMSCLMGMGTAEPPTEGNSEPPCTFSFSRAYDFRRHLSSVHDLHVSREEAMTLVMVLKRKVP